MEKFKISLSSLTQVFSRELLESLEHGDFQKAGPIVWGSNKNVSLMHNDTSVKVQWNGTCTSFATVAAVENKLALKKDLSERSLWDAYGVYSLKEAVNAAQNIFILDEIYWPQYQPVFDPKYKGKGRYKLTAIDYIETDYMKVLHALDNGNPCVVAMTTPVDLYKGFKQVEENSRFYHSSGHAMCVSGYKVENGKGYFLVKNSWGTAIGNKGYQYVAFDLFNKRPREYAVFWEVKEVLDRGEQPFSIANEELILQSELNMDFFEPAFINILKNT